jgi:hypothetical protein
MDEQAEPLTVEEDEPEREDDQPTLSQRELVRASLLRCPPPVDEPQRR